jgi:hypothetical protein
MKEIRNRGDGREKRRQEMAIEFNEALGRSSTGMGGMVEREGVVGF